jgi:hypothetical protein
VWYGLNRLDRRSYGRGLSRWPLKNRAEPKSTSGAWNCRNPSRWAIPPLLRLMLPLPTGSDNSSNPFSLGVPSKKAANLAGICTPTLFPRTRESSVASAPRAQTMAPATQPASCGKLRWCGWRKCFNASMMRLEAVQTPADGMLWAGPLLKQEKILPKAGT